jgi:hypothetical protein
MLNNYQYDDTAYPLESIEMSDAQFFYLNYLRSLLKSQDLHPAKAREIHNFLHVICSSKIVLPVDAISTFLQQHNLGTPGTGCSSGVLLRHRRNPSRSFRFHRSMRNELLRDKPSTPEEHYVSPHSSAIIRDDGDFDKPDAYKITTKRLLRPDERQHSFEPGVLFTDGVYIIIPETGQKRKIVAMLFPLHKFDKYLVRHFLRKYHMNIKSIVVDDTGENLQANFEKKRISGKPVKKMNLFRYDILVYWR